MIQKGKLVYQLPDDYVTVDLETTGLDAQRDTIIEVAAARVRNGKIVDTFESLIHIPYEVDEFITELTGITNEMLANAPDMEHVMSAFFNFLGDDILLGHYLCFDIRFINRAATMLGRPQKCYTYFDTMRIARKIFPEWKHHRLEDLLENLHVKGGQAHRALGDVMSTKACLDALCEQMQLKGITVDDLQPPKGYGFSKGLEVQVDAFAPDEDIAGKTFAFTGAMERMTRREAMQAVLNAGGNVGDGVNKDTNYLVLGNSGYCIDLREGKSAKRKKAEKMKLKGMAIEVISEDVFLQMLEPNE